MIHILALTPHQQASQQNRDLASWLFVTACAWLAATFLFQGFRNYLWWLPGGWVTSTVVAIAIIVICVTQLH